MSLGVFVLPLRVNSRTEVPPGVVARQRTVPHAAKVFASRTSETYVPLVARLADSRCTFPGLAVT